MDFDEHYYSHEGIQELKQKNSVLVTRLNECSQERDTFRMILDEREDQVKQSEEKLEALHTESQKICNENNNLKDQLLLLRMENKKLRNGQKNDSNSNEISNLKAQLENLTTTLRAENKKLKKVTINYEVMCNEHDKLKIYYENEKFKNKISTSSDNYSTILNENDKLKAQLENLTTTLRTESAKLKEVTTDYEVMCDEHNKLKIHLENEILKNNKLTNLYNDNSNLKVQIKECKKSLSTLCSEKEVLTNQLAELVAKNKKLKDKISTSSKSPNNYSEILNENENKSIELEEIRLLQEKNEGYVKEISNINNLLQKREKEKQVLIEKNSSLKKEASQYQSVLGTITNYRMDDDDKNHSVQLKKDIEELQNKLKNYITTLKGDCEIDFNAINDLMKNYSIKTKITSKEPNKPLIKAVLQHHIIKTITKDIRDYFKQILKEGSIMNLEKEIATKAKDLENKLACFSKTRSGNDTVTQAASIKVRQEVNIALGNRGYSDVLSGENYTSHGYIIVKTTELNREMNKYRKIKDVNKKNYIEKLAPDLIREFIRIFQFRLKVQEPSAQMRWIKPESSIDPSIMEGNWDKDDIDNLEVEICSFPMVGRDLDDVEKRKIYTHAQIFTKRITSKKAKVYLELESEDGEIL